MTTTDDIKKELDKAYSLVADHKNYEAALTACEAILETHPGLRAGLRTRAQIYAHKAAFSQAIADMTIAIQAGPPEPSDYFFRGWWNLEDNRILDAIQDFTEAISLEERLGIYTFKESAYFFRAVASFRIGRYDDALADCKQVRDDFLIYLRSGLVSKAQIVRDASAKT